MNVIPAPGSQEMQSALNNHLVHKIVDILLLIKGQDFFNLVARFLKDHDQHTGPTFAGKLQALRTYHRRRPNTEGRFIIPAYVDELISTLEALYQQDEQIIGFQRGAIVELLVSKLICPRCRINECWSNIRFVDGRYASDQVDVAVLSTQRQQIEGYTCKIKPLAIISIDCTNLTALANKAQELDFDFNIGAICFENSNIVAQRVRDRLRDIPFDKPFNSYGLDNILELEKSPFK